MGLLKLTEQLLLTRLPRITGLEIYWALSNLNVAIGLIVLVELARQSFRGARKLGWIIGTLAVLAGGVTAMVLWGPWPAWLTLTAQSQFAAIRVMQFAVDKGSLLSEVLTIELGPAGDSAGEAFRGRVAQPRAADFGRTFDVGA